jgi:hypothetical protein
MFFGVKVSFPTVTWITSEKCEPKVKAPILGMKKEAVTELMQLKGLSLIVLKHSRETI